jgi:Cof subfamily protein (haloacid dehalogenase superfamily)
MSPTSPPPASPSSLPVPPLPLPSLAEADIRVVATDLDGTLLDAAGQVSSRAAQAVRAARAAGIHVVPVTGRPPQALWHLARAGGMGPFGVCSNGAAVVDLEGSCVVETDPIAGEVAARLVDQTRDAFPGVILAIDDLDHFRYETGFLPDGADWDEQLTEVTDIRHHAVHGCVKLIARSPGIDAEPLMTRLQEHLGPHAQVTTSGLDWVEIAGAGVSKAGALARVCDRLGIGHHQVVAIGDNYNDLSVLAWAGYSLAPANAVPAVLELVDRVLAANVDDGVAILLEELVSARLAGGPGRRTRPVPPCRSE